MDAWNGYICYPGRSRDKIEFMDVTRSQLSHSTSIDIEGRTKPIVSFDYIVGLTDGEGCFYINVRPPRPTGRNWVETHFYIKVRIEDQPMLEAVKATLGCGAIYFQKETRPNHTHCCRYEVNNRKDIREYIIPLFTHHPLQSLKRNDFAIFKQVSEMIDNNQHQSDEGLQKIVAMKSEMNYRTRRVR